MQIAGFIKTSLIEWPGKISSVIFTLGCNFRCPFCHNADIVSGRRFSQIPEERILADLKKRKKWIDAVVVTGGEPTLQADLKKFLSEIKKMEFLTMIHTNGTNPKVIANLLSCYLIDYFCIDLKGDFENYERFTNVQFPMTNIQESLQIIVKSGVEYEFRTTVVPGLHDEKNLKKLAEQIVLILNTCLPAGRLNTKWYLQQFRPVNTLNKKFLEIKPFSEEQMNVFQKELQKIIPLTLLRGI